MYKEWCKHMTTACHFLLASLTIRILYPFGLLPSKIWEIAEVSCKYRIGCFSWKKVDIQKGVKTWVVAKELKAFHEKEIFTFNSTDTLKFYFQLTLDQVIEQN